MRRLAPSAVVVGLAVAASAPTLAHQPHDVVTSVMLSPDYASDRTVFAVGEVVGDYRVAGLYRSQDGGGSWEFIRRGLPHHPVVVAVSPAYSVDGTLFIGTADHGVYRSSDRGRSWNGVGLSGESIFALAVSSEFATDGTLYASTFGGEVYVSRDRGDSWQAADVGLPDGVPMTALSLSDDGVLFVGTCGAGLYRSADGGASWSRSQSGLPCDRVNTVATAGAVGSGGTVFAGGCGEGVFRSTDGGASWTASSEGIANLQVNDIVASPSFSEDRTVFATTNGSVDAIYRSTDGGSSWVPVQNDIDEMSPQTIVHLTEIALSPDYADDGVVFLSSWEGLHRSLDRGDHWKQMTIVPPTLVRQIGLSSSFAEDGKAFVSLYGYGVQSTHDAGRSWSAASPEATRVYHESLTVGPPLESEPTVFVGSIRGIFRSLDGGREWNNYPVGAVHVSGLGDKTRYVQPVVMPNGFGQTHETVLSGTRDAGVFRSEDGGQTWVQGGLEFAFVYALAASPDYVADSTVFVGLWRGGLMRSSDAGATFERLGAGEHWHTAMAIGVSPGYTRDGTLLVGTFENGLVRSTDFGRTWETVGAELFGHDAVHNISLSPHFEQDGTVYVGTLSNGVARSTDGGATWTQMGRDVLPDFITWVELSPGYPDKPELIAGGMDGTYFSADGGVTWTASAHATPDTSEMQAKSPHLHRMPKKLDGSACLCDFHGDGVRLSVNANPPSQTFLEWIEKQVRKRIESKR